MKREGGKKQLCMVCILTVCVSLSACGPAAIVGVVGSTITNAAYNNEDRKMNQSDYRFSRGLKVAIANLNLGTAYMQQGEYEKALEKLLRAQIADPGYPPVYNVLGLLYERLGESEKAEENFKKAIALAPNDSSNFNNYALFLCQQGRWPEAEQAFKTAAENPLYQSPELAYANAGTCALQNHDNELAESYFRKALDTNDRIPPALIQMSRLSYDKGNYLSAKGFLSRYLELTEHTPASLLLGIQIEKELGDRDLVSSYSLLLRKKYPQTPEAESLNTMNL